MTRINVDQNTSLQQLQQFAEKAGDTKIRGKQNQDGSFTLYTSKKLDFGVKEFFSGHRTERRNMARQALDLVFSNVKHDPQVNRGVDGLIDHVRNNVPQTGELRGERLLNLVSEARTARSSGISTGQKILEALSTGNSDEVEQLTQHVGNYLAQTASNSSHNCQLSLLGSDGKAVKERLMQVLDQQSGGQSDLFKGSYDEANPALKTLLDHAYNHAMMNLPDRYVDDQRILLGGDVYTKDRHLAKSGFGSIDVYKSPTGKEVVLKTPIIELTGDVEKTKQGKIEEARRELTSHLHARKGDNENVIGLKGAVRTPEGQLLIALEFAPNGNAHDLLDNLNKAIKDGHISQEAGDLARLTILQDMMEGLQHVQEDQGMIHLDFKPVNCFVDGNGTTKIGDFGTSTVGTIRDMRSNPIDNPRWLAPEVLNGKQGYSERVTARKDGEKALWNGLVKQYFPKEDHQTLVNHVRNDVNNRGEKLEEQVKPFQITNKIDTWSMGASVYQAFTGQYGPFEGDFVFEIENKIKEFGNDKTRRIIEPKDRPNGLTDIDHLINDMMHPDPQQRPTISQALQSDAFSDLRLGTTDVRNLIKKLCDKDATPEELRDLSNRIV